MCRIRRGSSPRPPDHHMDAHSPEPLRPAIPKEITNHLQYCKVWGDVTWYGKVFPQPWFTLSVSVFVLWLWCFLETTFIIWSMVIGPQVSMGLSITRTYLYYFDPLKPHFYIVKLGFTGVYIIFLISAQNIDCGYSLEPPRRGGSNEYPQSMFWAEIRKNIRIFYLKIFIFGW